jgi:hypothetical protein
MKNILLVLAVFLTAQAAIGQVFFVFAASSVVSLVILGVIALAAIIVGIVVALINAIKGGGAFSVW